MVEELLMNKKFLYALAIFLFIIAITDIVLHDSEVCIDEPQVYINGDVGNDGMVLKVVDGIRIKADTVINEFEIPNDSLNKYVINAFIILGDGAIIYESGYIYPGETVEEIDLFESLKRGTYKNSVLLYKFYTVDEPHIFISQCEFPIEIKCF